MKPPTIEAGGVLILRDLEHECGLYCRDGWHVYPIWSWVNWAGWELRDYQKQRGFTDAEIGEIKAAPELPPPPEVGDPPLGSDGTLYRWLVWLKG